MMRSPWTAAAGLGDQRVDFWKVWMEMSCGQGSSDYLSCCGGLHSWQTGGGGYVGRRARYRLWEMRTLCHEMAWNFGMGRTRRMTALVQRTRWTHYGGMHSQWIGGAAPEDQHVVLHCWRTTGRDSERLRQRTRGSMRLTGASGSQDPSHFFGRRNWLTVVCGT